MPATWAISHIPLLHRVIFVVHRPHFYCREQPIFAKSKRPSAAASGWGTRPIGPVSEEGCGESGTRIELGQTTELEASEVYILQLVPLFIITTRLAFALLLNQP